FRNSVSQGDLIIVSKGNAFFRAIGIVTGGYEYVRRDEGRYSHRRAVKWLWHDADGVPVENIYAHGFMMKSIYLLKPEDVNETALQRYLVESSEDSNPVPEQFVLIIDEINR